MLMSTTAHPFRALDQPWSTSNTYQACVEPRTTSASVGLRWRAAHPVPSCAIPAYRRASRTEGAAILAHSRLCVRRIPTTCGGIHAARRCSMRTTRRILALTASCLSLGLLLGACTSSETMNEPVSAHERSIAPTVETPNELSLTVVSRACWPNGMSCSSGAQCCSTHCVRLNNRFQCGGEPGL